MAFSARSDEHTVFRLGVFRNRALLLSIGLAVVLQIAVVYAPFMQAAFGTVPLTLTEWGIIVTGCRRAICHRRTAQGHPSEAL